MRERTPNECFLRFRDAGDAGALGELFDLLAPELTRVAWHVARDAAEAEDLVQASFLALLEHPERVDASRPVAAWLVGVLTNEARSWGRGAARRPDADRATGPARERERRERPDRVATDAESRGAVRGALERLPALYREVLSRHLLDGRAPGEIAAERGASPSTVRVQLHRGMARLRELLPAGLASGAVLAIAPRGADACRRELVDEAARIAPLGTAIGTGSAASTASAVPRLVLGALASVALAVALYVSSTLPNDVAADDALSPATVARANDDHPPSAPVPTPTTASTARAAVASAATDEPLDGERVAIGALRVAVVFADGAPAPDIIVECRGDELGPALRARTDESGTARFDDLAPGTYSVYGDRGGHAFAQVPDLRVDADRVDELREAFATVVALELPPGIDVGGRVVDATGAPVAGADVWISTGVTRSHGTTATTTDADGAFALRQLSPGCFLGARAVAYAPSRPVHVQHRMERAPGADPLAVVLELPGAGARVSGVVRVPSGAPARGAEVRVGAAWGFDLFGPTGAEGPPPPAVARTDEHGRFAVDGVAPGTVTVAARHADERSFAVAVQRVDAAAGDEAHVTLDFALGAFLVGVARGADGAPVARAVVAASVAGGADPFPRSSFDEPRTVTDDDGRFELGPLPPGAVEAWARKSDEPFRTFVWTAPRVRFDLAAGERRAWDPALAAESALTGTAVGADGAPLVGWTIASIGERSADGAPGPPPRACTTGDDGSFALRFPEPGRVTLTLTPPDAGAPMDRRWVASRAPHAWLEGVAVDARDVRIAVDPAQVPDAALSIDVVVADGLDPSALALIVWHERWGPVAEVPLAGPTRADGVLEFHLDALPEGRASVRVRGPAAASHAARHLTLERGRTVVADALRIAPAEPGNAR